MKKHTNQARTNKSDGDQTFKMKQNETNEYVNLTLAYECTLIRDKVEFGILGTRFAPNFRHFHIIKRFMITLRNDSVTVTNNNKSRNILVSIVISRLLFTWINQFHTTFLMRHSIFSLFNEVIGFCENLLWHPTLWAISILFFFFITNKSVGLIDAIHQSYCDP